MVLLFLLFLPLVLERSVAVDCDGGGGRAWSLGSVLTGVGGVSNGSHSSPNEVELLVLLVVVGLSARFGLLRPLLT